MRSHAGRSVQTLTEGSSRHAPLALLNNSIAWLKLKSLDGWLDARRSASRERFDVQGFHMSARSIVQRRYQISFNPN